MNVVSLREYTSASDTVRLLSSCMVCDLVTAEYVKNSKLLHLPRKFAELHFTIRDDTTVQRSHRMENVTVWRKMKGGIPGS